MNGLPEDAELVLEVAGEVVAAVAQRAEAPDVGSEHFVGDVDDALFGDGADTSRHAVIILDGTVEEVAAGVAGRGAAHRLGAALEPAESILLGGPDIAHGDVSRPYFEQFVDDYPEQRLGVLVGHLGAEPPVAGVAGLGNAGVHAVNQAAFAGRAQDFGIQRLRQHGVDQAEGVHLGIGQAAFHKRVDIKIEVFDGVVGYVNRFAQAVRPLRRQGKTPASGRQVDGLEQPGNRLAAAVRQLAGNHESHIGRVMRALVMGPDVVQGDVVHQFQPLNVGFGDQTQSLAQFQAQTAKMIVAAGRHLLLNVAEFGLKLRFQKQRLGDGHQHQAQYPVPLEIGAFGLVIYIVNAGGGIAVGAVLLEFGLKITGTRNKFVGAQQD